MIQKKTSILSVSALLVLLAFTIGLTALVLNSRNLRSSFAEYITQQTERNVTIGGDVEIDFGFSDSGSLLLTLKTEDVVVYNNPDFSAEPMLHVPSVELEFGLLSILTGGFDVYGLLVERPIFDLVRLTDGRSNWQDIGILAVVPAKQVNAYAGVVHWRDGITQQTVTVTDLSWRSSRSETDPVISWQASFRLLSEVLHSPLVVRLSANASFKPGQSSGVVLNEVVGDVTAAGLVLSMRLPEMSVNIDNGRIHMAESAVNIVAAGGEAALKIVDLNIDTSTRQIGVALLDADCFIGRFTSDITADEIVIDLSNQRIVVPKVAVTWLDTELFGNLSATWAEGEPEVLADFDIPSVNVQAMLHNAGITLTDFVSSGLRPISLNGKLRLQENQLTLDGLNLKAADTVVTGWVKQRRENSTAWTFALHSDDVLLVDKAEDGSRSISSAGVFFGLLVDRLSDLPTGVTATGSVVVDRLWIDRVLTKHVIAKVRSKGKIISIAPLLGEFYDGTGKLHLWLDRRAEAPIILVRQAIDDFNLGKLIRDAYGVVGIEASADLELVLAVEGRTSAELLKDARGSATVGLRNGELSAEMFNRVLGNFNSQMVRAINSQLPELKVEQASTTIRIDRGIVQNQDFRFVGREFWIEGKGSLSLPAGAMNYKILFALENDLNRNLGGIPVIPFQVTGSVGDPKFTLDVQELVRHKITHELTGVSPRPSSVLPDQATTMLIQQLERRITNLQQVLDPE